MIAWKGENIEYELFKLFSQVNLIFQPSTTSKFIFLASISQFSFYVLSYLSLSLCLTFSIVHLTLSLSFEVAEISLLRSGVEHDLIELILVKYSIKINVYLYLTLPIRGFYTWTFSFSSILRLCLTFSTCFSDPLSDSFWHAFSIISLTHFFQLV